MTRASPARPSRCCTSSAWSRPPAESVLIQARGTGPGRTRHDPALRRRVGRRGRARCTSCPGRRRDIRSPLGPGGQALISRRRAQRPGHVPGGRAELAVRTSTVGADLAAVARVQARHPGLLVREAGDASTDRAANTLMSQDFRKAELTSVPITLILLIAVFGALIAAGIPVLLAGSVGDDRRLAARHPQPLAADRVEHLRGGADHRDGGRRRLLPVLPAPGARGAGGRCARSAGRWPTAAGHLRPGHRGLRADRDDLAGRAAADRDRPVHRHRGRHHHGGRRGRGRLADLPARAAVAAGPWADRGRIPFLGRQPHRRPGRPGCGPRWSAGWCGSPLLWGGAAALACSRWPCPRSACAPAARPSTCRPGSRWCTPSTRSSAPSRRPAPAQVVVTGGDVSGPGHAGRGGRAADHGVRPRGDPPAGHRRSWSAAATGCVIIGPAGRQRHGHDVPQRPAGAARPDPARHDRARCPGPATRSPGTPPAATTSAQRCTPARPLVFARGGGCWPWCCSLVAFRSLAHPADLDRAEPALGRRGLRPDHADLPGRPAAGPARLHLVRRDHHWVPLFMFVFLFGLSMDYHVFILSRIRELRAAGQAAP